MTISLHSRLSWLAAVAAAGLAVCSCRTPEPAPKRTVSLSKEQAARLFGGGEGKPDASYRERRAREYFLRGSSLQMEKRHAEAILDFQMALRFDTSAVTLYALAKNFAELDRHDAALEYAQAAILRDSTFLPALEAAGASYLALGEFEKAAGIYEKLTELDSGSRQHRFVLARIYEIFDAPKAVVLYNALIAESGDAEQFLRRLVEIYRNRNEAAMYESMLERLYAASGEPAVNEELIAAYCESRNFVGALAGLARATAISESGNAGRLFGMVGQALLDPREKQPAPAELLRRYVELAAQERFFDWQPNVTVGMAAYSAGEGETAQRYFERAALATDQPDVPFRIGIFYLQNSDYSRAGAHFERYDSVFAGSRFALYAGYAYASAGDYEQALAALQRGAGRDTGNVELWAQTGLVLDHLGRAAESDRAYETALRLDPDHPLSNNNLAYSLAVRGMELQRAHKLATKAVEAQPRNASFLDTYGWILFGLGKYDDAAEYLEKATNAGGASATVYEHLGDCYRKLGMNDEAAAAYRAALELSPERASAAERLRELTK